MTRQLIVRAQWYIVVLLACLAGLVWFFAWESSPVSRGDKSPRRMVVPAGWSSRDIAAALHKKGLIRSEFVFRMTARVGGQAERLKPGAYDFNRSMSIFDIIGRLSRGEVAALWVTIPEGYTIRQIGKLLEEKQIVTSANFIHRASVKGQSYTNIVPVPSADLEGYLFPDTYLLAPGSTSDEVVKEMLETFRRKVVDKVGGDLDRYAPAFSFAPPSNSQVSSGREAAWYTVLTVASMIEREAKVPKDRPLISGVIWNRLRKGMKLEIDATVLYAMGHHKSRLTYADLKIRNPYNTYFVNGLPAGPIANPGLASIEAALSPANVDYLYYVAGKDGSHVFSRTADGHERAKIRVRSGG